MPGYRGLILRSQIKVEGESRLKTSHNAMGYTPTYTPWMHTWSTKVYFKIKFKTYNKDKINYFGIKMKVSGQRTWHHKAKGKQTIRVSSTEQNSTTEKQRTFSLQLRGKKVLFMVEVKKMRLL